MKSSIASCHRSPSNMVVTDRWSHDLTISHIPLKKCIKIYQIGVSKNNGTPKSSIITHPFWGPTPIFGSTPTCRWSTCQAKANSSECCWNFSLFPRTSLQRWLYKGQLGPLLLHLQEIKRIKHGTWRTGCQWNTEDDANSEMLKNL